MQIAGVHAEKGRRGNVKELTAEEKYPRAVRVALTQKFLDEGYSATPVDVKITAGTSSPKGKLLKDMYQHNGYKVSGTVKYFLRNLQTDKVREAKTDAFTLEFCDCLDSNGLPEFKIEKFVLE